MLQDTLNKIEIIIQNADSIDELKRRELKQLAGQLRQELAELEANDADKAHSIAEFTKVTARQSLRSDQDPELVSLSSQSLNKAISEFETSHPKLYETIQSICVRLTGLGV